MALTDTAIRAAKPAEKPRKLYDEKGLFLIIAPSGGKWWRFKYTFDGKAKTISLGTYPDTSLALARDKRDKARQLLARDIDPGQHRKATKNARLALMADSFEAVAREWHTKRKHEWVESHAKTILSRLEKDVFPWLGSLPIAEIDTPEVLAVLHRIEERGALGTVRKVKQYCGRIFKYAISCGKRKSFDPCSVLDDSLASLPPAKHFAAIVKPEEVGALMRAIEGYGGSHIVRCALKLHGLSFLRSSELRQAKWDEIDLDNALWVIPAERMKGKKGYKVEHHVPLSRQAVKVLRDLHPLTGHNRSGLVFPGQRSHDRPISENTINSALRRLGYSKDEMTAHGFRAMARTLLDEKLKVRVEVIEMQLAHKVRDMHGKAYNRTSFMHERIEMMQQWADYLDSLRDGAKVVSLASNRAK